MIKDDADIVIVTAYFDIGRGSWTQENGYAKHLLRTNETYLNYFKNLAKLDNEMVVYTSQEFVDTVYKIRQNKPTTVIAVDLDKEFKSTLEKISSIQQNQAFIDKIPEKQRENPEYWSPYYILVTNLKSYFVTQAINKKLINCKQIAWVDFGYCREDDTLKNITHWRYNFNSESVNLFALSRPYLFAKVKNPRFPFSKKQALNFIFNNRTAVIGGVIVAHQEVWSKFHTMVSEVQTELMNKLIIDDDQGVYIYAFAQNQDFFKLHYLGRNPNGKKYNWFGVMQLFHI